MSLFPPDFLQRLEYLSLVSRRTFRGSMMGQRMSRISGTGIEFSDHRPYTPGDDFRSIDWNLYARHDELLLKRFQEEQDLNVRVLLDVSPSMSVPDTSKFDTARQLAAAFSYLALAGLDRIAVSAFAGGILQEFPLTRGKSRALSMLRFLEQLQTAGHSTSLHETARKFVRQGHQPGLVIVISDLYCPDGYTEALDLLRYHRCELHVVQIHHPQEADPQLKGDVEVEDSESGEVLRLTLRADDLRRYRELFAAGLNDMRSWCLKRDIGWTCIRSDTPYDEAVLAMMQRGSEPGMTERH